MRFLVLVGLEATVIAGSGIDARWRPASERRIWFARWVWWHLAPLWLVGLGLTSLFMAAAMRATRRACERYEVRQANAHALVVPSDSPVYSRSDSEG